MFPRVTYFIRKKKKQELGTAAHVILAQEMETGEWLV